MRKPVIAGNWKMCLILRRGSCLALTLLWLSLLGASQTSAQQVGESDLYFTKCKAGEGICDTQEIVRYRFLHGKLVERKVIFTSATLDVRFDLGDSRILRGELLVSSFGDVIDLKNGKCVFRSTGSVVRVTHDKLLIDVDNIADDDLYEFDFKTRITLRYKSRPELEDLEYYAFSPNGENFAVVGSLGTGIRFYKLKSDLSVELTRTREGSFGASCSIRCSGAKVPVIWIDNTRILTQETNGRVVIVNQSGTLDRFPQIKVEEEPDSAPYLGKDQYGSFFYSYDGNEYLLNVAKRTYSTDRFPLGNDFARLELNSDSEYFFRGRSIGSFWSGETLSTPGYLAATFATKRTYMGFHPEGIKIWNSTTREWTTLEEPWSVSLVGWVQAS